MAKARFIVAALGLLFGAPAIAAAQEAPRIAYVDTEAIIQEAPGYGEASAQFQQTTQSWQDTLEQKRAELQRMFEEYKKQEVVLSPEEKTEKQQTILQLERETQQYFQEKFGPEGEASERQSDLMRPIIQRVNEAIERVRQQQGYALVFDLNAPALVAGDPALNITDQVIQQMNQQAGGAPSR